MGNWLFKGRLSILLPISEFKNLDEGTYASIFFALSYSKIAHNLIKILNLTKHEDLT